MGVARPRRVTLWKLNKFGEYEIDYNHELSDGFGIPAVVVGCPLEHSFEIYSGIDECGDTVMGISFDECSCCPSFISLDLSQAIMCELIESDVDSSGGDIEASSK